MFLMYCMMYYIVKGENSGVCHSLIYDLMKQGTQKQM